MPTYAYTYLFTCDTQEHAEVAANAFGDACGAAAVAAEVTITEVGGGMVEVAGGNLSG